MAKGETHVLPSSYIANSRNTDDCFCHMRNNVCDMAQFLREGLLGRLFMRPDGRHIEGGFPHKPIDFGRKEKKLPLDQALDTRFFESVGTYQASHQNNTYRLNSLNVFAIGYILRNAAMFCVKYKFRLQLLIDSVICTMLPKFKITRRPDGTVIDESQKYYELKVAQDPTTPKENEFYVTISSGDLTASRYNYYFFNPTTNGFVHCITLDPRNTYYLKDDSDGLYVPIGTHVVGDLTGHNIYQQMGDGSYRNLGFAWDETNRFGELIVVIPGLTRNNTYESPSDCVLFRQVTAEDTETFWDQLYVDCTNEDVERVKNYVNILIKHYRAILIATSRKKSKYRQIVDGVPFTIADLIVRINALVECADFRDQEGRVIIHPLNENEYTIRDMKLKINELVDAINQEAFFLNLIDINFPLYERYTMMNAIRDFLDDIRMNEKAWKDLVASGKRADEQQQDPKIVHEFDGYCYNDLGFVYNPYDHQFNIDQWDWFDFTKYDEQPAYGTNWIHGRVVPHPDGYREKTSPFITYYTQEPGDAPVNHEAELSDILDLVIIADTWRACDYVGSMYVLDCTLRLFDTKSPDGDIWKDGLVNPRVPVTPEQQAKLNELLDIVDDLEDRLSILFGSAPVAALTVADLGLRVSDYSVIYTCE